MRYVNSEANVVPDIALSMVVLFKVFDLWKHGGQQAGIQHKKAELKTPHFLSWDQDMVVSSE